MIVVALQKLIFFMVFLSCYKCALFSRQHNGKFRTLARLRNHFDIAALPCYDLAGQIQANAHALLFVYFFLTIEAPEDSGLIAFRNSLCQCRSL